VRRCPRPLQAEAPPPDLGQYTQRLNDRVPELDAKIAACDKELLGIKAALARAPPSQQASLKQKALALLKRRKVYEGQRGSVQTRAFNLEQTQFAMETVKDAQEHMAVRGGQQAVV